MAEAMKPPAPAVLRKGAVVGVAGPGPEAVPISPKYALVFIDLQYDDGHVERWLGAGSLHDDPSQPFPCDSLVQWGKEVVEEQSMLGDLGRAKLPQFP